MANYGKAIDRALSGKSSAASQRCGSSETHEYRLTHGKKDAQLDKRMARKRKLSRKARAAALKNLEKARRARRKKERRHHPKRRHESFAAWTLLFYALWHRCHIAGRAPESDVFATLGARG